MLEASAPGSVAAKAAELKRLKEKPRNVFSLFKTEGSGRVHPARYTEAVRAELDEADAACRCRGTVGALGVSNTFLYKPKRTLEQALDESGMDMVNNEDGGLCQPIPPAAKEAVVDQARRTRGALAP